VVGDEEGKEDRGRSEEGGEESAQKGEKEREVVADDVILWLFGWAWNAYHLGFNDDGADCNLRGSFSAGSGAGSVRIYDINGAVVLVLMGCSSDVTRTYILGTSVMRCRSGGT